VKVNSLRAGLPTITTQMEQSSLHMSANVVSTLPRKRGVEDAVNQNETISKRRLNYKKCVDCRRDKQKVKISLEFTGRRF
jgi:hypothetical protein